MRLETNAVYLFPEDVFPLRQLDHGEPVAPQAKPPLEGNPVEAFLLLSDRGLGRPAVA